jgi:hypothetical protein
LSTLFFDGKRREDRTNAQLLRIKVERLYRVESPNHFTQISYIILYSFILSQSLMLPDSSPVNRIEVQVSLSKMTVDLQI